MPCTKTRQPRSTRSLFLFAAFVTFVPFVVQESTPGAQPDPYAPAWQRLDETVATRMRAANHTGTGAGRHVARSPAARRHRRPG